MAALTVFCGKGGVGKTTLSLACGFAEAGAGRRTLVVTSHPLSELSLSVSLHGLEQREPRVAENLFVVHIDPREILSGKIRQQLRSSVLARAVLSSRLYQNLVEVAPGLKEVAFLARLRQLAESTEKDSHRYDRVIWDAPASGHFLQTLKVARSFDQYMTGPFSVLGRDLVRFFSDPANLHVFPVTILEEMAVAETAEMCAALASAYALPPAAIICNMASPLLSLSDDELSAMSEMPALPDWSADVRRVLDRHGQERDLYRAVQRSAGAPLRILHRVPAWSSDLDLLERIASRMASWEAR